MNSYEKRQKQWQVQVARLAHRGFYSDAQRAAEFFQAYLFRTWRAVIVGWPFPYLTATDTLIIHLFARGVLGVGTDRFPDFVLWPPSRDVGYNGLPVVRRAIPVGDIARLIGRSRSAVETGLAGFKGMGEKGRLLRPFVNVISLPTGVAVDGWLSPRAVVPFMYTATEYADAMRYATRAGGSCAVFVQRQRGWCEGALEPEC